MPCSTRSVDWLRNRRSHWMHEASGNTPPAPWEAFVSPHLQLAHHGLDPDVARVKWDTGRRMAFGEALEFALATVSTPLENWSLGDERVQQVQGRHKE